MNDLRMIKVNNYNDVTLRPFSYVTPSVRSREMSFLVVMLLHAVMLFLTKSYDSLVVVACAVAGSMISEVIYTTYSKQFRFSWLTSLVSGFMIGLLLPSTYPPFSVFLLVSLTLLLGKYVFGGFAGTWINPVAITVALAYFLDLSFFPTFLITQEQAASRNASLFLIQNEIIPINSFDSAITHFFNTRVFNFFGVSISEGYVSFFWDNGSVIPAFRFNLIVIVSSLFLFAMDMVDLYIPTIFIVIYSSLVRILGPLLMGGQVMQGDVILALLTSGTLFSTLFLLQWYGTTPMTRWGKTLYAVLAGIIGFFIIGIGTSPVGYIYTVLVLNIISPLIQVFESKQSRHRIIRVLIPHLRKLREVENA